MDILKEIESLKIDHYTCGDSWYNCPMSEDGCANEDKGKECDCNAPVHNAKVDEIIEYLKKLLDKNPNL